MVTSERTKSVSHSLTAPSDSRHFFYGKEHQNWFGVDESLGPVAVSVRRERVGGGGEAPPGEPHYMYRLIVRTSELLPLRYWGGAASGAALFSLFVNDKFH